MTPQRLYTSSSGEFMALNTGALQRPVGAQPHLR